MLPRKLELIATVLALVPGCGARTGPASALDAGAAREADAAEPDAAGPCGAPPGTRGQWRIVSVPTTSALAEVLPRSPTDVWIVGDGGTILHWNGIEWTTVPSPTTSSLGGIWLANDAEGWITADRALLFWDGQTWSRHDGFRFDGFATVGAVRGTARDDVWIGGGTGPDREIVGHWDGRRWSVSDVAGQTQLTAFDGTTATGLWAVAHLGDVLRLQEGVWRRLERPGGETITSLWVAGPSDVWFTALHGEVKRLRDDRWETHAVGDTDDYYYSVWGSGPEDIWVVGYQGTAGHWDGVRWEEVAIPADVTLASVRGTCPLDVWAVGEEGTVLRFSP